MKIRLRLALMSVALAVTARLVAQDDRSRQLYNQAESEYQLGQLSQAQQLLEKHVESLTSGLQVDGYRLLALCYLGMDNEAEAERCAAQLLRLDPYYSPSAQDPARFIDMIGRLKGGFLPTITTASSQSESLDEVPVPTTLITEEMIHDCGARTLKELLVAYVPGITNVESNEETIFAMRGIYSAGQENVLILLDGHRLNSYSTNIASPDFSISLEKVKQVEILRGPASSLYGGVAYTGVVNIITKTGLQVDGLQAYGAIGNYGQLKGSLLFGKRFMDMDVVVWGSIYNSTGQKIHLAASEQPYALFPIDGDICIGGYNSRPSYDVGAKLSWKGLQLIYNSRFSKLQSPYTMSVMFAPYSYDNYRTFNSYGPGYASENRHGELSYTKTIGPFDLKAAVRIDKEMQQRYQVVGDTVGDFGYNEIVPYATNDTLQAYYGYFQNHFWQSNTVGANIQADYHYQIGHWTGNLLLGADFSSFRLLDSSYFEGDDYGQVLKTYDEVKNIEYESKLPKNLAKGREKMADCYLQLKQRLGSRAIMNVGIRYDYKHRNKSNSGNRDRHVLSPRLAFIYKLKSWSIKASYSKAFVDAPYFYRNSSLDISALEFFGLDLEPEFIHSLQLSLINNHLVRGLNMEFNVYYNHAKDIIYNDQSAGLYINAGHLKTMGAELSLDYKYRRLTAHANVSWQNMLDAEFYNANQDHVYNIPPVQSNLVVAYRLTDALKLHANAIFTSKQVCQSIFASQAVMEEDVPSRVVANVGASYDLLPMTLKFNVYNLFNKEYYQGGNSTAPIRQQGLWFLFSAGLKL